MKKLATTILILVLMLITGCKEKPLAVLTKDPIEIDMSEEFDPYSVFSDIQDNTVITYELDEENSKISFVVSKGDKQELHEGVDVKLIYPEVDQKLLNAPYKAKALEDIEIHDNHSADSNLTGYVREGDSFEVYETYQDEDNVWCRISSKHWINNSNAEKLEIIPNDTDIAFIKNEITYVDEHSGGRIRQGILLGWYSGDAGLDTHREWGDVTPVYDEQGRVVKEIIDEDKWWDEYTLDEKGNIIHVNDYFGGCEYYFDFTYDDQNRIITESNSERGNYTHEYESNGNLKKIITDSEWRKTYVGTDIQVEFEYNGNLRFEIVPDFPDLFHMFRYDNNGNEIERFTAPEGDVRNPMPGIK